MDALKQFLDLDEFLSEKSKEKIFGLFKRKEYKKNTELIKQGTINTTFFFLAKGIVRSYLLDKNNKEKVRRFFTANSAFTSLNCTTENTSSYASYETLNDVVVYESDFKEFHKLTIEHHDICTSYSKTLEKAFDNTLQRVINLSTLDATERYV